MSYDREIIITNRHVVGFYLIINCRQNIPAIRRSNNLIWPKFLPALRICIKSTSMFAFESSREIDIDVHHKKNRSIGLHLTSQHQRLSHSHNLPVRISKHRRKASSSGGERQSIGKSNNIDMERRKIDYASAATAVLRNIRRQLKLMTVD